MAGIVSLADVKSYLRITSTNNDALLNLYILGATAVATYWFGEINSLTVTGEVHDGGHETILLRHTPILSVTTVTEYIGISAYVLTSQPEGSTVNNYGYSLDLPEAGLITRRSGAGTPMPFLGGDRAVIVSYVAGRATVPDDVYLATLEDIRGLWQQTQQGGRPQFGGAENSDWNAGPLHQFPRLASLAASSQRTSGIA